MWDEGVLDGDAIERILDEHWRIAGQAEFLISNDKHFLELKDIDFPAVNTVTLQEFIHQI